MTQRTYNIIQACKGNLYSHIESRIERVKQYMSEECLCDIASYTDNTMEVIMLEALCDYIDSCEIPSVFLRFVLRLTSSDVLKDLSLAERICEAFVFARVKGNGVFINRFNEKLL